ncbi:MAG: prepilin-type N-terminal cleavage/methylation domain-containing protein [Planctomycetota bacterium]
MGNASRPHPDAGFSLIEVMFATAVLALIVAGLTQTVVSGQAHTYNALHEGRALSLGEALMDEVLTLGYTDPDGDTTPGPDSGETTRDTFDALDDYHGYTEAAGALTDPAGVAYPELHQKFERSVTAEYDTVNVAVFGGSRNVINITVTVAEPGRRSWTITRSVPEPAP